MGRATPAFLARSGLAVVFAITLTMILYLLQTTRPYSRYVGHVEPTPLKGRVLGDLLDGMIRVRLAEMEALLSEDERTREDYRNEMMEARERVLAAQQHYRPWITSEKERHAYEAFTANWQAYLAETLSWGTEARGGFAEPSAVEALARTRSLFQQARATLEDLAALSQLSPKKFTPAVEWLFLEHRLIVHIFFVFGVMALVALLMNIFYFRRS